MTNKNSILDLLEAQAKKPRLGQMKCCVARAYEEMTPEDAATLKIWVDMDVSEPKRRSAKQIISVLEDMGVQTHVSQTQLGHHRRGNCSCAKE